MVQGKSGSEAGRSRCQSADEAATADQPPAAEIVATARDDPAAQQHDQLQHFGPDHGPQPARRSCTSPVSTPRTTTL